MAIYNTPQEQRDIELLEGLGFEVLNPNSPKHIKAVEKIQEKGKTCFGANNSGVLVMEYFTNLVEKCDVVAFRALPDGRIPAGIAKEIGCGKTVFELPSGIVKRTISIEETREYLREAGQR
jgi:hypothetical protein